MLVGPGSSEAADVDVQQREIRVSEVAGELARVRSAFEQPTLTLLHQRQAPVVIAVFRAAFGRDNRPIPTARLHAQVEDHLASCGWPGDGLPPAAAATSASGGCAASGWCGPWTTPARRSTR